MNETRIIMTFEFIQRSFFISFQSKSIEELQEVCLEEVLGISRKRLLSIINATKCPSDTDSSDSDVDKVEGEISIGSFH